jgi:hypothetical protein
MSHHPLYVLEINPVSAAADMGLLASNKCRAMVNAAECFFKIVGFTHLNMIPWLRDQWFMLKIALSCVTPR